ncbi:MAG: LptF/LptG family permease, partial [Verrucomicrobiota bacterium]
KTNTPDASWRRDFKFLNARDNRSWWIKAYNLKTSEMQGVVILWRLPEGRNDVISAKHGLYADGVWRFTDVQQLQSTNIAATPVATNQLEFADWPESPALIRSEIKINSRKQATKSPQLSIRDILNYQDLHPRLDKATSALLKTRLHERIAAPSACMIVVLIALPFGVLSGRRNVYVGVASSIFICFAYFILLKVGIALGTGGYLPGWLAAWLPNILFGSAAVFLTMRVR